jgi:hypothetical protein
MRVGELIEANPQILCKLAAPTADDQPQNG